MMGHTVVYDGSYGAVWPCDLNHFWFFFKDFKDLYEVLHHLGPDIIEIIDTLPPLDSGRRSVVKSEIIEKLSDKYGESR